MELIRRTDEILQKWKFNIINHKLLSKADYKALVEENNELIHNINILFIKQKESVK